MLRDLFRDQARPMRRFLTLRSPPISIKSNVTRWPTRKKRNIPESIASVSMDHSVAPSSLTIDPVRALTSYSLIDPCGMADGILAFGPPSTGAMNENFFDPAPLCPLDLEVDAIDRDPVAFDRHPAQSPSDEATDRVPFLVRQLHV